MTSRRSHVSLISDRMWLDMKIVLRTVPAVLLQRDPQALADSRYIQKNGKSPSKQALRQTFPDFTIFKVDDVKRVVDVITTRGGQVINGPMEVPGGDWIVQAVDPQGAMFAAHATAANMKKSEKKEKKVKAKGDLDKWHDQRKKEIEQRRKNTEEQEKIYHEQVQ